MSIKILILFCMIFCHIVDDYYLQGILASMKQKEWWKEFYPDDKYKKDYIVALIMHGFSWTFMIMLSPTVYLLLTDSFNLLVFIILFVVNAFLHTFVDNQKANKKTINLITDQSFHIIQIIWTWLGLLLV